jgi:hypothetical protein
MARRTSMLERLVSLKLSNPEIGRGECRNAIWQTVTVDDVDELIDEWVRMIEGDIADNPKATTAELVRLATARFPNATPAFLRLTAETVETLRPKRRPKKAKRRPRRHSAR